MENSRDIPTHVYLAMIQIIITLINHHSNNECIMAIHNKQASFCSGNCLHVID